MNLLGQSFDAIKGKIFPREESAWKEQAYAFLDEIESGQFPDSDDALAHMLEYARTTIPYYQRLHETHPLTPASLEMVPPLTKELIRANYDALKAPDIDARLHWEHASGGSTGKPVKVIHDEHFAATCEALSMFATRHCFGGPFTNQLVLWGSAEEVLEEQPVPTLKSQIKDKLLLAMEKKTTTFNTFNFTPEKMVACVETLNRQKPEFIFGYAGSVYELAKYMQARGIKPARAPQVALLTAQTCYPHMREMIETVLGCQICNHYGSREVGPVSWEACDGKTYHFDFIHLVEVVDDGNRRVPPGTEGRVLVSTLHNFAMPLIRYDIGDRAIMGERATLAGRSLPTFEQIVGKTAEHFKTPDGTLVHGQFFINLFYFRDWIDAFQVVQKTTTSIDVLYTQNSDSNQADIKDITVKIKHVMGAECTVTWRPVEVIPKTAAGKQFCIRSDLS